MEVTKVPQIMITLPAMAIMTAMVTKVPQIMITLPAMAIMTAMVFSVCLLIWR
jgi:hypothetical protein